MKIIDANGEFGQVAVWDSATSDFSDWTGDEGKPFSRTATVISVATNSPYEGSVIIRLISLIEASKLILNEFKICSEIIDVPSGKVCVGDAITDGNVTLKLGQPRAKITIFGDDLYRSSKLDIIVEEVI
ncbi:hypothetical protein [Deinococcus humi]|uniref:Uncharacterized protein n=1 Tax=Deinococcus humi TaxID=662880 RepID=A0A7W8JXY6_9DEIO|nr:hypothetical protein [Deinococcus humi]MBB5363714.1 hypothetical protein [Deinococcus humi]GGO29652.1 hypothetical protein GCM10008949_23470 [Deinococcus humi]